MRFASLIPAAAVALFVTAIPCASAQEVNAAPPAHVSFVQGQVTIDHGDESEPAAVNMPVVEGDRIVTGANARAEVMFPDGSAIEIDPASDVELVGASRVRVVAGAIEHRSAARPDPRSTSTQNLPPDLQPYAPDLDQNGSWQNEPEYGNVWYPNTVSADWRPYYDGYWYSAPRYGWTWVADARWAWPTHHYGRWGYARSRWFWIPGRSYAPAWVSWGTAADYVSWCPLGYDGRPVVALSVWWSGSSGARYRRGPDAWTVVRRDHFGSRAYSPRRYGVDPYRLAANTSFIEHRTPPSRERRGSFSVGAGSRQPYAVGRDSQSPRRDTSASRQSPITPRQSDDRRDTRGTDRERGAVESTPRTPGSAGVAVPRYGRDGNGTDRDRESRGDRRSYGERAPSPERQRATPTPTIPPTSADDHPAYRPRYTPREQQPSQTQPGNRDRRSRDDESRGSSQPADRPSRAPERSAPRASQPSAPPPSAGAPARRDPASGHTRERSSEGRSSGTATRRPR